MVNELTSNVRFHDAKQVKIAIDIITRFCNGIPKFILKGNTSNQVIRNRLHPTEPTGVIAANNKSNYRQLLGIVANRHVH